MSYTPLIWPLIVAVFLLTGMALYARRYYGIPGARPFSLLMWLGMLTALLYAHEISTSSFQTKIFVSELRYIPLACLTPTLFMLALEYTRQDRWLARRRWLFLYLLPAITILLSLTSAYHHLFRYDFALSAGALVTALITKRGIGWDVYYLYSMALSFGACAILLASLRHPGLRRGNTLALAGGILFTSIADILFILKLTPIPGYYWTPSSFVVTGALFGWALLRGRMFSLTPIPRNTVLENISDIVLVLDRYDHLLDFNRAAAAACRLTPQSIGLSPLLALPSEWSQVFQQNSGLYPLEQTGAAQAASPKEVVIGAQAVRGAQEARGAGPGQRVYELTISPIQDKRQHSLGRLFLFHDITQRQQAQEHLQQSEEQLRLKLDHLLTPDYDLAEDELQHIIDSKAIQALLDDFYQLTQIGITITDLKGNLLVKTGWQDICTRFHRVNPETLERCSRSDPEVSRQVQPGAFFPYKCQNNLWDIVTPIMIGERRIGNLYLGQFFYEDEAIDYELFTRQAERYGFDKKEYLAALKRVPRWSREKVEYAKAFFAGFSALVSQLSFSNLKLAQLLVNEGKTQAALRESEQRYRLLAENIHDVIWTMDRDYQLTYISPSIKSLRGVEPEEAMQEHLADTLTPESYQRVIAAMQKRDAGALFDPNGITRLEVQQTRKDGSLVWVEMLVQDMYDEQNRFIGVMGVSRDISERKRSEQELAAERNLMQDLMDNLPDAIYFKDLESRFIRINKAHARRFGFSDPAQAIGKTDFDFFAEPSASEAFADEQRILQTGQPLVNYEELELWFDRPDSWVSTTKMPLRDHTGKITGTFGVSRDITQRKLMEQQLQSALAQKETLLKEIHHRVKNNLAVISSLLDMQATASQDERLRLAFQDSQRRIQSMARIHEQLYHSDDLEHIDMGRYLPAFTEDLLSYDVMSKTNVQVEVHDVMLGIDQAIPCGLIVNELVTNALKYAFIGRSGLPLNDQPPMIRISMERQNGVAHSESESPAKPDVCLIVSDNGAGLPADIDLKRPRRLGLKLVTRLASQLHGELELESSPDAGTTFKITFPAPF